MGASVDSTHTWAVVYATDSTGCRAQSFTVSCFLCCPGHSDSLSVCPRALSWRLPLPPLALSIITKTWVFFFLSKKFYFIVATIFLFFFFAFEQCFTPKCYVGESNLTPQFICYVGSLTCVSLSVNAIVALPSTEHL